VEERGRSRSFARIDNWEDLVWPGEFIFGYPAQGTGDSTATGRDRLVGHAPSWARSGSYLVVRRLRQNVFLFHQFVRNSAALLDISADLMAARMIGRWPSGTALLTSPANDDPLFDAERAGMNDFAFTMDPGGFSCPISAHIRKMHPRLVTSPVGNMLPNPGDTLRHRILRRGLPYGPPSPSTIEKPIDDEVDRGLLFMSYQTSIEEQFEFILRRWANEPNFPEPLSGFDPIVGQNHRHPDRRRSFQVKHGWQGRVTTELEWVIPTGGGYFFAPGREGFQHITGRQAAD
jgi:Dyp-type peroxidase family